MMLGAIAALWRYPVKSMAGEPLDAAQLHDSGFAGDRVRGVLDVASGTILSAKRVPRLLQATARYADDDGSVTIELPDGTETGTADRAVDARLSTWLDRQVRLVEADPDERASFEMDHPDDDSQVFEIRMPPGRFSDTSSPIHLLTTASLRAVAASYPDGDWDPRRFRANVVVDCDGTSFVEEEWVDSELSLGAARLFVRKPTGRCVLTTRAQPGLVDDTAIYRTVRATNAGNLGVYLRVVQEGPVAVGDAANG